MRRLGLFGLMAAAVIMQVSFLPGLRPLGVVPNLTLVALVLCAQEVVTSEALAVAAAGGLLLDLSSAANFGLWTGLLVLTALTIGLMRRSGLEVGGLIVAIGLVVIGTIVMGLVIWLSVAPAAVNWGVGPASGRLFTELMVNLIITLVLFGLVNGLLRRRPPSGLGE